MKSVAFKTSRILTSEAYFRVENGTVTDTSMEVAPAAAPDRLYLVNASGTARISPCPMMPFLEWDFTTSIPDKIRDFQDPDPADVLLRDGSNLDECS